MLQPIGAEPAAPPDASVVPPLSPPGVQVNVNVPSADGATQELCEKANTEALLATGGYALGASLLALVVFVVLEKRMVRSEGFRLTFGVGLGALVGAALTFADPARGEQFVLCLNDPSTAVYLTLATQPAARALALGFAPALVLTLMLCMLARRLVK